MRDPIELGRGIIQEQAAALSRLAELVGDPFYEAVELILPSKSQMVVCGIGKSGLIARKAAATLASTGTPAIFMHPVEGVHGDLGAVGSDAVLLAMSKSGHTEELVRFVNHFRRIGGSVIAICEPGDSPLAALAKVVLPIPKCPEAGPLALAPTTSTLMMLSLCDALAMALLDAKGFDEHQFARYHPDGSLGRRLLTRASDLMHSGEELPVVKASDSFSELLMEATGKHIGMACVEGSNGKLLGVITDGDLRRLLTRCEKPWTLSAAEAWRQSRRDPTETPVQQSTVKGDTLAVECLRIMRESEITFLLVSQNGVRVDGVVRLQDLVRAGLG